MGHRANYVIKTEIGFELYYSHWGANVVPGDLFWGPEETIKYVRSLEATEQWLDNVWCEGGACLDLVNRHLLFFGGENERYDPYLLSEMLNLYRVSWAPWTVEWAMYGIADLARAVDVPLSEVITPERVVASTSWKFEHTTARRAWCKCILTIDGVLYTLVEHVEYALSAGERLFDIMPRKAPKQFIDEAEPQGGADICRHSRTVRFWILEAETPDLDWVQACWEGWDVTFDPAMAVPHCDRVSAQIDRPTPSRTKLREQLRGSLLSNVGSRALSLPKIREAHGEDAEIELNPLASEDVRPEEKGEQHEIYLDAVLAKLEEPW